MKITKWNKGYLLSDEVAHLFIFYQDNSNADEALKEEGIKRLRRHTDELHRI